MMAVALNPARSPAAFACPLSRFGCSSSSPSVVLDSSAPGEVCQLLITSLPSMTYFFYYWWCIRTVEIPGIDYDTVKTEKCKRTAAAIRPCT